MEIKDNQIIVGNDLVVYSLSEFKASYIRYPYDLIPPHSSSFSLRENMEYFKTIALLFDKISINNLCTTWKLRNRVFSLGLANKYGILTPKSVVTKKNILDGKNAVKALGNCFVSEHTDQVDDAFVSFLSVEEDDGDKAVIMPASVMNEDEIVNYLASVGVAFVQDIIYGSEEFRAYIIGNNSFVFKREQEQINTFDKSAHNYGEEEITPYLDLIGKFIRLMSDHNLGFLCFDFIRNKKDEDIVIDINPYGSMPLYEKYPKPSLQLAKMLLNA